MGDAAMPGGEVCGKGFDRCLIQRIQQGGLGLPPAAAISAAMASCFARVRPARMTLAPSRAKARASAPPSAPAAAIDHGNPVLQQQVAFAVDS